MAGNQVDIRVTVSGAEAAARVLQGIGKEGGVVGTVVGGGLGKAEQALGSFSVTVQKASSFMGQAGISTGLFGQALGALTSPLGLAAAGVAALGAAIHTASQAMVKNFEEVRRLQAVSGLSADAADNLADTFQLLGFKSEVLTTALVKMAQEVDSGGKGLAKLGVSIADLEGKVEGDTFLMLRDRISELGTAGERSAAGMALFGRGFRELAPLFAMSSAEMEKFQARASKFSEWSEEAAELTHRFVVSGNTLGLMFDGIAQEIGAGVLPGLTAFNEGLADWVDAARDMLRVPVAAMWSVMASVIVGLWQAIKPVAEVLWELAKVILPPVVAIMGGLFLTALIAIQAALIPLTGAFVFLSEILKGNFAGALKASGDAMAAQLTNIDETLAKSKVLGDALGALARGEVQNTETVDAVKEKSHQKNAQLDALRLQAAQSALQVAQANAAATMALEEAMAKQRVALSQAPETDLISVQQRALEAKAVALKASYANELALAKENNDLTGKAVADVQAKYIASYSQIAVARVDLSTRLLKIAQEEEQSLASVGIGLLQARLSSSAALLAIQQKSTAEIIAVQGTEEAVFRARLGAETQAAIEAAEAQVKTQADYAAAVEAIMAAHYAKLAQFQQQASERGVAEMIAGMAMALKEMADLPEVEQLTKDLVALNREIMALKAPTDLDAEAIRRFGVSFDLLDDAAKRALVDLRALKDEGAGRAFAAELTQINVQAQLFGDRFDAVGARVSALQGRLSELARTSRGEVTPAMRALADELENLRQFQDLEGMFKDIFSSVGGAINTLVQGVILGTQTMGEAFKKLGQSIVIEFVNRVIQQALNPLMKAAANVVASLFSSSGATSSPAAATAAGAFGGMNSAGFGPGEVGGSPLVAGAQAVGSGIQGMQTLSGLSSAWTAVTSNATNAWSSFTTALDQGGTLLDSLSVGVGNAMNGLDLGLSGMGLALGYAGSAVQGFLTIMDKNKTDLGKALQTATLAAGAAAAPFTAGISLIVAPIINWIEDLFGLFSKGPSNYDLKRIQAADDAGHMVGGIGTSFQYAARTGTAADTLAALIAGQAPAGSTPNPLRTDLSLPPSVAEQLGLAAKAEIENGRAIVHWADVTQAQFDELITLFKSDPSMIAGSVMGKGDVSYLGQDKTLALGNQLEQGAVALLSAFTAFDSVRDKIKGLSADIVAAAGEVMPPNMAGELAAHIVDPIRDSMLAVLQVPDISAEEIQSQLEALGQTLEAKVKSWEQFAQAMQAAQIIAPSMPDDLPERMTAALAPAYDAVVTTMRNGTARQAQAAADGYAKQVALWAAFGEAVTHAIDLEAILPEDLGSRFEAKMQPQYDKILATLEAGNVNLATAQVAAYTKQMAAWASIGQTVSKITSELAANSGDTSSAVETWQAVQGEMDRTVARAKVAFDAAVNSGDIERVAKTAATYHDATMARLQAERAAVQQIEASFATLLKAAAAVQDTLSGLAAADVGRGDATAFTAILHALADMAMVAPTLQQRLAAIGSGFSAIVAALANTDVDALLDPLTIVAQMSSAAAPFFGALSDLIETATKAGDLKGALGLLQQQADAIKQLGAAAVQAVHEWASAAITAVEKEAAAKLKAIDEQANAEIKLRQAAITNWQAQLAIAQTIESLYTGPNSPLTLTQQVAAAAVGAGQAALARFQAAPSAAGLTAVQNAATRYLTIFTALINDQIALLQRWQSAVDSANGFIEQLYTGPNSPLSLTEQRGLAAGAGQGALSAYNAGPTPEGLTALQAAASRYLTISLAQIREKADAEIAAVEASRDARVTALNAEIQAVQDAAAAEQQLIADRIEALQEQVSVTREWEGVVKSVGDLIQSMVIGPMAAGNPADRLTAAKDAFAQSQAAFNANPTAANAADVQSAAQALLPLAESLLSKPSPAYQALFASVIKVLEGVKGTAGAMAGPVSSADLEKQIKPLQEESKRIGDFAKQAVDGIQMQIEAVNRAASDTITAINEAAGQEAKDITQGVIDALTAATALAPQDLAGQTAAKKKELQDTVAAVIGILADAGQLNGMSSDDLTTMIAGAQAQIDWWTHWRETETDLVAKWKQSQIDVINETAKTTTDNIEAGVAAALRKNAADQKTITDKLVADTAGVLAAVTRGAGSGLIDGVAFLAERSIEANGILVEIREAIRSVTGAATGIERVEPGLYELHKNEAVLTEPQANKLRAMGGPRALDHIRSAAAGVGMNPLTDPDPANHLNDWNWIYNQPRDLSKEGQAWAGPKAAELNALELKMQQIMQQFEGTLAHNVQKKGGRRVQIYSDDEIALMRDAMTNQVKAIKDEQIAIIATVPKTPATPATPPGTPPTVPPKVPPYTPPGPGWLTKTEGEQTDRSGGGVTLVIEKGAIVITGVSDPEKAANLAVEKVQTSVASGKIGLIIDKRVRSLPAR